MSLICPSFRAFISLECFSTCVKLNNIVVGLSTGRVANTSIIMGCDRGINTERGGGNEEQVGCHGGQCTNAIALHLMSGMMSKLNGALV